MSLNGLPSATNVHVHFAHSLSSSANLFAGPGYRSTSPSHPRTPHDSRPNHALTSGLIIAASVIVAAGIAI